MDLLTSYGNLVRVRPSSRGIHLSITKAEGFDSFALHLDESQATTLAHLLPGGTLEVAFTLTERGFYAYPEISSLEGPSLRVQESSAASGPHVWIFQEEPEAGDVLLSLASASILRSSLLTWLADIPSRWS